ncbi:MAG: hypothetical protein IKT76_01095 [Bacteroides sp.]|nr:hypothetical protein [Bacteroides sp.]
MLINDFFDKEYQKRVNITEVLVKGKKLKPYKLTYFRSITLKDAPDKAIEIEERLLKDAEDAVEMNSASLGKRLYFGFYCLPPRNNDKLRYIFYRNTSAKKEAKRDEVTLVYMEGYATLDEIEKMFK